MLGGPAVTGNDKVKDVTQEQVEDKITGGVQISGKHVETIIESPKIKTG